MPEPPLAREVTVVNRLGLHARAAARFVRLAERFEARVLVAKDDLEVAGTSILGLMMLTASPGSVLRLSATGPQAEAALEALVELVARGFDEE